MGIDPVFVTQFMWALILVVVVLVLAGDDKTWINRLAVNIVREHRGLGTLKFISSVGFLGCVASMGTMIWIVMSYDLFGGTETRTISVAMLSISVSVLSGWFIRLWDNAIQKHECIKSTHVLSCCVEPDEMSKTLYARGPEIMRTAFTLALLFAFAVATPGFLLSKRAETWSQGIVNRLESSTVVLFMSGLLSATISFFVGTVGFIGLMLMMTVSKNKEEYLYGWLAWAIVSSVSMFTVTIARQSLALWRERMSEYLGEFFGW